MSKREKNTVRRHEATDPMPMTLPVQFQKPPTLAEQIARHLGAQKRWEEQHALETAEDALDFGDDDEDEPTSIHELVFDPELNRELTRYEKAALDKSRARFDAELQKKIAADRAAKAAADEAERRILEKSGQAGVPDQKRVARATPKRSTTEESED